MNRRDFLKLAGVLPAGAFLPRALKSLGFQEDRKNIIVVVFDAFSARHMSLYGYGRKTTPNIARLAERAIVYHNHYSGSNYTTSGTASIFTGALPWTHRALQPNSAVVDEFADKNLFSIFKDHYRIAYSHNEWVNTFLSQFKKHLNEWIPREQLYLPSSDAVVQGLFPNDRDIASVGWVRNIKLNEQGSAYSLFLSRLISSIENGYIEKYRPHFPRGLPTAHADNGFILAEGIDWIARRLAEIQDPIFGYFHFLPPHDPYRAARGFAGKLRDDGYIPMDKPHDIFATDSEIQDLSVRRTYYDEFILNVDYEFGQLFDDMETSGMLKDTLLVLTSDHGETFERGISGHTTNALYEPLVRVPLLIFEPGRTERLDIHETTSVADLLPTLSHWAGLGIPDWTEGELLPPYRKAEDISPRAVYSVRSYGAVNTAPLTEASIMMVKGRYKLHFYFGYSEVEGSELVKLYDVENDPEELKDLSVVKKDVVDEMLGELRAKLKAADKPYL